MRKEELEDLLQSHKFWLNDDGGQRADLSYADLRNAYLRYAGLRYADLRDADLRDADLIRADLSGADLSGADLSGADLNCADLNCADLSGANLRDANLSGADLRNADLNFADLNFADLNFADLSGANLRGANLRDANLSGADLSGADLSGAKSNEGTGFFAICCPEKGAFVGFKKINDKIVELEIPAEARRSSATTRKCRCEFAKVLSITNLDGDEANIGEIVNTKYEKTEYKVGEMVYPDKWDDYRWNECSHGIHFFITREEAVNY